MLEPKLKHCVGRLHAALEPKLKHCVGRLHAALEPKLKHCVGRVHAALEPWSARACTRTEMSLRGASKRPAMTAIGAATAPATWARSTSRPGSRDRRTTPSALRT